MVEYADVEEKLKIVGVILGFVLTIILIAYTIYKNNAWLATSAVLIFTVSMVALFNPEALRLPSANPTN